MFPNGNFSKRAFDQRLWTVYVFQKSVRNSRSAAYCKNSAKWIPVRKGVVSTSGKELRYIRNKRRKRNSTCCIQCFINDAHRLIRLGEHIFSLLGQLKSNTRRVHKAWIEKIKFIFYSSKESAYIPDGVQFMLLSFVSENRGSNFKLIIRLVFLSFTFVPQWKTTRYVCLLNY